MTALSARISLVAALALSGCVYISTDDLTTKTDSLDEDGDGVPHKDGSVRDCDDHDPERFPAYAHNTVHPDLAATGNLEVPYDAIDQDCDEQDLVDVDGDTFPGIAKAQWDAIVRVAPEGRPDYWPALERATWQARVLDGNTPDKLDCDDDPSDDASRAVPASKVNPTSHDTPYDGVDADCKGDDDYDSDHDGYVPNQYASLSTLPAGDCDDGDSKANPGIPASQDIWYNGKDEDCAGNNDFDVDGDGYMPNPPGSTTIGDWQQDFFNFCIKYGYSQPNAGSDPASYQDCYQALYGQAKTPQWGDCADSDADGEVPSWSSMPASAIHPGANDVYYDGVDANCNQDDDFDKDGDLYIEDQYLQDYADYVAFWHINEGKTKDQTSCHSVTQAQIAGNFVVGICGGDDCDDSVSSVHPNDPDDARPGVMEVLGDTTDQDCDGGRDTTPMRAGDYHWSEPRNVVAGRDDLHWLIATGATATDASAYTSAGFALVFDSSPITPDDDPPSAADDPPIDTTLWWVPQTTSTVQTIGPRIDMIPTTDGFYGVLSYVNQPSSGQPSTYLMVKNVYWEPLQADYRNKFVYRQISGIVDSYPDVDLRVDGDGNVWGFGCGANTFAYVVGDSTVNLGYKAKGCLGTGNCIAGTPGAATQCFVEPPAAGQTVGQGTICDGTTCTTYDLDGTSASGAITVAATQPYSALTYSHTGIDYQKGYRTIIPASGPGFTLSDGTTTRDMLGSYTVRAAAAADSGGKLYIFAVVADQDGDGADDLVLSYGPKAGADGAFTKIGYPLVVDGYTFKPREVSVYVDNDRLMLAVSGDEFGTGPSSCRDAGGTLCDVVAWSFLGPP